MRHRELTPELMDDPSLPRAEHLLALNNLARLNRISRTADALWPYIRSCHAVGAPITVLDVATGSGDVPAALARLAARAGIAMDLHACDVSPVAIQAASDRFGPAAPAGRFFVRDAVRDGLPYSDQSIDIAMCSLFLHHLSAPDAARVLREMARVARRSVLVSDLRRCRPGLAAAYLASRLVTRSRVVHADAVLSVRAAFTPAELRTLADQAGLHSARVARCTPFRMILAWTRP